MYKYSFADVLTQEIVLNEKENRRGFIKDIEIPMIQRDYAQGREDQKEVRNRFLDAIFSALKDKTALNLDFIYGSLDCNIKGNVLPSFIPLDGQQRLTTLFLLYWYIGNRELQGEELIGLMGYLVKFTYATRASSRRFCEKLVTQNRALTMNQQPQIEIMNQPWYFKTYSKDPTIQSMLTMLDAIADRYNAIETEQRSLFAQLENLKFYLLPLEEFKLTDELYVKMNARGKLLTKFENFKADLTNWMKKETNPLYKFFQKTISFEGRKMSYSQSFSLKLDVKWTEFFWKNCSSKEQKTAYLKKTTLETNSTEMLIDIPFLKFLYRHFFNEYILSGMNRTKDGLEPEEKILNEEKEYQNLKVIEKLLEKDTAFTDVEKILDSLVSNWEDVKVAIIPSWGEKFDFLGSPLTQPNRVVWLAITAYLKRFSYDNLAFKAWMRVVWNIVSNTDINDINSMIAAMNVIHSLSDHANRIYAHLATEDVQISSSKLAMIEEIEKSKFILSSEPSWEECFINAESHQYFKGCISFLISDSMTQNIFNHRYMMASKVFDANGVCAKYRDRGHIFLRAIISQIPTNEDFFNSAARYKSFFVDKDENEHYLKKLLAGNQEIRKLFCTWFDLSSEEALFDEFEKMVEKPSEMRFDSILSSEDIKKVKNVHQLLYMEEELQNWMQDKGAIRLSWWNSHIYISKPFSRHDWVMLDTQRNQIIFFLLDKKGFECKNKLTYDQNGLKIVVPKFYWGTSIDSVTGKVGKYDTNFMFDDQGKFSIQYKLGETDWTVLEGFADETADENTVTRLEERIFKEYVFEQLVAETLLSKTAPNTASVETS